MYTQDQVTPQSHTITRGIRRPSWICRNAKQNVVFARDASGSMAGQKAKDASAASLDLVAELATPVNKDGFNVAVVDFDGSAKVVHGLEKASVLQGSVKPLSTGFFGGSTNITSSLEKAREILERASGSQNAEGITYLRPVVIVFSDGGHNTGPAPHSAADQVKALADLVTVAFGSDADEPLLRGLATSPAHFYRCSSGRELRKFLASVGATLTATLAAGTNATQALATIPQP